MTDQTLGEGGTANTPPFPRRPSESPSPARSAEGDAADVDARGPVDSERGPAGTGPGSGRDNEEAGRSGNDHQRGETVLRRVGHEALLRFERALATGLEQIADQLDDAAQKIDRVAHTRLDALSGQGERAAQRAHDAAGSLNNAAVYLRSNDLHDMRIDIEARVREKPLQTLLLSASVGWLLGKILR